MKYKGPGYGDEFLSVITKRLIQHFAAHVLKTGMALSDLAEIHYPPGVILIPYSGGYIDVPVFELSPYATVYGEFKITYKEIPVRDIFLS